MRETPFRSPNTDLGPGFGGSSVRLVWLFDVDGTLLLTGGASREAFSHAVRERIGAEDDLKDIRFDGRTEPLILADILAKHRTTFRDGDEAQFWNAVFDRMRVTFRAPQGHLLPGVPELLEAVDAEPAWARALLTGNMTEMARIKLERFGLGPGFHFGAYGEEAEDRNALARVAVARASQRFGVPPERCVVVGDTEHDIACARAVGARVVAVATGGVKYAELERHAPDLTLESLAEPARLLEWAREVAATN